MTENPVAASEVSILEFLVLETGIILSGKGKDISGDTSLASFGFDSLSFVELLISIEKKFKIKLIEIGLQPVDMKTLATLAHFDEFHFKDAGLYHEVINGNFGLWI